MTNEQKQNVGTSSRNGGTGSGKKNKKRKESKESKNRGSSDGNAQIEVPSSSNDNKNEEKKKNKSTKKEENPTTSGTQKMKILKRENVEKETIHFVNAVSTVEPTGSGRQYSNKQQNQKNSNHNRNKKLSFEPVGFSKKTETQQNGSKPLSKPPSLLNLNVATPNKWGAEEKTTNKQAEAVKQQRTEYYYSENAGCAPSSEHFQKSIQYQLNQFPIEKNERILIDKRYDLMIQTTNSKCDALFVRVKSQDCDETFSVSALIPKDSDDRQIRAACQECLLNFDNLYLCRKNERSQPSECSRHYLQQCYIIELSQPSEAFPEAIYYCNRCDFHINSVVHAKSHLEQSSHFDDVERLAQREKLIQKIPPPTKNHLIALEKVLNHELEIYEKEKKINAESVNEIIYFLRVQIFESLGYPNVEIHQYGSTVYDVDLSDSDLNLAFSITSLEPSRLFLVLNDIVKTLKETMEITAEITSDGANSSAIVFTYSNIPVRLCWFSMTFVRPQRCFADLLKTYVSLRPEVVQFLRLVRIWARKAKLDSKNKQKLGLPRYGFDIMVIHFLQKAGMLPILHELNDDEAEKSESSENIDGHPVKTANTIIEEAREKRIRVMSKYLHDVEKIEKKFDMKKEWNLSSLWIDFFKYYLEKHREIVIQITQTNKMTKEMTKWNRKTIHVVDPFRGDNVLSIPKSAWLPYFFNCILSTFVLFAIPRTENGPVVSVEFYQKNKAASPKKKLRGHELVKKDARRTPQKMIVRQEIKENFDAYNEAADEIAIEDEVTRHSEQIAAGLEFDGIKLTALTSENVEIDEHVNGLYSRRTLQRIKRKYRFEEYDSILNAIEEYDMLTTKKTKKKLKKRKLAELKETTQDNDTTIAEEETKELEISEMGGAFRTETPPAEGSWQYWDNSPPAISVENEETFKNHLTFGKQTIETKMEKLSLNDPKNVTKKAEFGEFPSSTFTSNTEVRHIPDEQICTEEYFIQENFTREQIEQIGEQIEVEQYVFVFDGKLFSGGCELETKCSSCDGNHLIDQCPIMQIPPIETFTKRTKNDIEDLDRMIDTYYESNIISKDRLRTLELAVKKLEAHLREKYDDTILLTIFGSVMTGMGQNGSDIDICLRFENVDSPPEHLEPVRVITEISEYLRRYQKAKRVQAITTAKVPIVKFHLKLDNGGQVDADISYYNILAIYNTKMLKEYTLWTPDHRFAKLGLFIKHWAKSCDIGDASKGSISSYAYILLLISYLQRCDPPVLPRLQEDFRDDDTEKRIIDNWDTYFYESESEMTTIWQKNQQSSAELLMGFFEFYSRFGFRYFVVQCRREAELSKLEKEWNKPLCIEDPFDLHHNLGSGVTKKMFVFILKNFISSRKVFAITNASKEMKKLDDFPDKYRLKLLKQCSQGHAPIDRQCHACGKIGHYAENCPKKMAKNEMRRTRISSLSTNASVRRFDGRGFGGNDGNKKVEPDYISFHKRCY